jgi:hypothetical protein
VRGDGSHSREGTETIVDSDGEAEAKRRRHDCALHVVGRVRPDARDAVPDANAGCIRAKRLGDPRTRISRRKKVVETRANRISRRAYSLWPSFLDYFAR